MRILIEEYQYDVADVRDVLQGIDALESIEGKVSIHYVGYYYNALLDDCVFILPKVLLQDVDGEELAFGKYTPKVIINPKGQEMLSKEEQDFLYGFAVWIYRAIVVYKNGKNNDTTIIYQKKINHIRRGNKRKSNTFLDILLSLIQFNKDNKSFFFFVLKNLHAGFHKINWTRTISTTPSVIQDGSALYLNPVNKKHKINFDEELLVVFFSILNYISDKYGFQKNIDCNFELIQGKQFERYLNGYGKIRLNQIRYKYFSDKALQLWKLCYAFFDKSRQIYVNTCQKEYLLVKNFHIVFEAIIDTLVGDNPLPDDMDKKQKDGKIVDHLFTAKSLIEGESANTYYIGDSKYYKMGSELGKESVCKQYTYAKNVIQWNLDIFNNGNTPQSGIKLRDDETEGYNIIPNFFISATLDDKLRYAVDGIKETDRKNNRYMSKQFHNRLFDRDTLLLFHYDVNFLFVLSLYARNNGSDQRLWKEQIRGKFRTEIQNWLQQDFDFFAMRPLPSVDVKEYVETHFRQVLGKVYKPFAEENIFSLALDKKDEHENKKLIAELEKSFVVRKCQLGINPHDVLPEEEAMAKMASTNSEKNILTCLVRKTDDVFNAFAQHEGKAYVMEKIPNINIMGIKYLLPMVGGMIDGYYDVLRIGIIVKDNKAALRLRLGEYHNIGEKWVPIYRNKMQPGELISLDYTIKIYKA